MTVLGDCLLHREHHQFGADCVHRAVEYLISLPADENWTVVERYRFAYERACLDDLLTSLS